MQKQLHRQQQFSSRSRSSASGKCHPRLPSAAGIAGTVPAQVVPAPFSTHKQQRGGSSLKQLHLAGIGASQPPSSLFAVTRQDRGDGDDLDGYSHYTRAEAIQVTLAIGQSSTWQQLSLLYKQHRTQLWHINIAAMFRQLSKLHLDSTSLRKMEPDEVAQLQDFYTQLGYTAARAAHDMQPRELCTIASAAAQVGLSHPWLCDALADATEPYLRSDGMSLRQAAQLTHAFGKMSFTPGQPWLQALLQTTQPFIAIAAVQAALAVHEGQSASNIPSRQRRQPATKTGTNRATTQGSAGQRVSGQDQSQSRGQYSQRNTGQPGQRVLQPEQSRSQGDASNRGHVGVQLASESLSRSLANTLHALACRMRVRPPLSWLHIWLLATQQCLVPAEANAAELVQMLQALAVLSSIHTQTDSSVAGNDSRPRSQSAMYQTTRLHQELEESAPSEAAGQQSSSAFVRRQQRQAQEVGQLQQLLAETQWLESCCSALQRRAGDMTPTMAQAALSALAVVAQPHGVRSKHVQAAALALLHCACAEPPYPAASPSKDKAGQLRHGMWEDAVEVSLRRSDLMATSDSVGFGVSGLNARRLVKLIEAVRDLQVPKELLRQNSQLEQLVRQHTAAKP